MNSATKPETRAGKGSRARRAWLLIPSLFIFIANCSFEKPSAPSWDVEVSIPLLNKNYTMKELIEDQDVVFADSTGLLNFEETVELENHYVGDALSVEDIEDSFSKEMGAISIDSPDPKENYGELGEIIDDQGIPDGSTIPVPEFDFVTDEKVMEPFEEFTYVLVEEGVIEVVVSNNLPIILGPPLTLQILNSTNGSVVADSTSSKQVLPGQQETFTLDLAGKTVPNTLSVVMSGHCPGSDGNDVNVDYSSRFEITATINEMTVTEAEASIPAQRVPDEGFEEDFAEITDSLVVHEATIESGNITLQLGSALPVEAWLTYQLPDFVSGTGSVLTDSLFLAPGVNIEPVQIDLAGYYLRPAVADFGNQKVRFAWAFRTIDTEEDSRPGEMAIITNTDRMSAEFSLTGLTFASVTGKMGSQEVDVEESEFEIDIPADLDSIFFETARLELSINNSINFPARILFNIQGENEDGSITNLSVDDVIEPSGSSGETKTSVIVLDQQNSDIKDFISILPSLIRVDGKVRLGDENWIGSVTKDDFVNGTVNIRAPLSVRLPDQSIDMDTNEMDIDEDVQDDIINNLASGAFYAEINNALPVGASLEIYFGDDSTTVYNSPVLTIGPLSPNAGVIDNSGFVDTPTFTEISFNLTEDEIRTFTRKPLFSGVRVGLQGTDGNFIKLRESDYIQIKAYTKIGVKVNQD
jgi:hypothetical protein